MPSDNTVTRVLSNTGGPLQPGVPAAPGATPSTPGASGAGAVDAALDAQEADADANSGDDEAQAEGGGSAGQAHTSTKSHRPTASAQGQGANGNDASLNVGDKASPPASTEPLHPALEQASAHIAAGNSAAATDSFKDYLGTLLKGNNLENMDVNAIIQAVLLGAYKDNQEDLKDYANKVHFYQTLRKNIRADLTVARNFRAEQTDPKGKDDKSPMLKPFTAPADWSEEPGNTYDQHRTNEPANSAGSHRSASTPPASGSGGASGSSAAVPQPTQATSGGGGATQLRAGDPGFPASLQPAKDWSVFKTSDGGMVAVNFSGKPSDASLQGVGEVRVFGTDGEEKAQAWGSPPHLLYDGGQNYKTPDGTNKDGKGGTDLHGNSVIYLQDGTQVSLGLAAGANGKQQIGQVDVLSGSTHYSLTAGSDPSQAHPNAGDGATYASAHPLVGAGGAEIALQDSGKLAVHDTSTDKWNQLNFQGSGGSGQDYNKGGVTSVTQAQQSSANGQAKTYTTQGDMDAYIKGLEDKLNSVGDDSQLAQTTMQSIAQKGQEIMTTMSNLSKNWHDIRMAILRNIS